MTRDEFINKAKLKHGDKYDYLKSEYVNGKIKTIIICPEHGEFLQTPEAHLFGNGCNKCAIEYRKEAIKSTSKNFIENAKKVHGNKYDYSKLIYKSAKDKVKIICPIHGEFSQIPNDHLNGSNCPECAKLNNAKIRNKNTEYFIKKAKLKHGNKYDYSKVNYQNNRTKVCVICPKHGEFWQKANSHTNGQGCPICNESSGENTIRRYLENYQIGFIKNYKFNDCINKRKLPFDFYIPNYNICIEYDGIQHYESVKYFGGIKRFEELKIKDKIKTQYCIDNNITLIRIPYTEFNSIENILKQHLNYGT